MLKSTETFLPHKPSETPAGFERTANVSLSRVSGASEHTGHTVPTIPPPIHHSPDRTLEEDDVLLVEIFRGGLVRWRHAVAVAEPVNVYLDAGRGVRTEAPRLQVEAAAGLRVGRDGGGRLRGRLSMGLRGRHGRLLETLRVGDADGGRGLGVWAGVVCRTEWIWHR